MGYDKHGNWQDSDNDTSFQPHGGEWVEGGDVVTVKIENVYSDGHQSSREVQAPGPVGVLGDWWEEVIWPLTGDGSGEDLDANYTATIIACAHPGLLGKTYEWG